MATAALSPVAASNLTFTLTHAITYLTKPLINRYPQKTIDLLQLTLEKQLTTQFSKSWCPSEPLRGSGRRCLTLAPKGFPPRPIYLACVAAGVQWQDWIALLGDAEFDLFIDPGTVSVRFGNWGSGKVSQLFTVWSAEHMRASLVKKIVALQQQKEVLQLQPQMEHYVDDDEEELFTEIAEEVATSTWISPLLDQFPAAPTSTRRPVVTHSRASSRASSIFSDSESVFSFSSVETVSTAPSSDDGMSQSGSVCSSRTPRERVFIDKSKKEVTPYDGGKTTVLTGGVMLGRRA